MANLEHLSAILWASIKEDGQELDPSFTKVYGLTVIERSLRALERAEVKDVLIVSEKEGSQIEKLLQERLPWKFDYKIIQQDVLTATIQNKKSDGYLLLGESLVVAPDSLKNIIEKSNTENIPFVISQDYKIAYANSSVLQNKEAIPKTAPHFFKNLSENLAKAKISISQYDTSADICSPVSNKQELKSVKKALIRSLTKPTDGWVSRNLNRPISTLFSRVLAYTAVTPNQFTIITGLLGVATGVFMALGGYFNNLIGGALFHLTSVFDGVDGELARLKFKSSPFGQWLDTLVDNLTYLAALAGIIIGIYRNGAPEYVKIAGILSVIFAVSALVSLYFYLLRFNKGGTLLNVEYSFQDGNTTFDKIMRVAAGLGKRDLFALIFFILGIFGQLNLALVYVCIMAAFVFGFSIQAHFRAAKKQG